MLRYSDDQMRKYLQTLCALDCKATVVGPTVLFQ